MFRRNMWGWKSTLWSHLIQNLVSGRVLWELSTGLLQPSKEKSIDFVQEGEKRADFRAVGDNKKSKLEKLKGEHGENQREDMEKRPKTRCGEILWVFFLSRGYWMLNWLGWKLLYVKEEKWRRRNEFHWEISTPWTGWCILEGVTEGAGIHPCGVELESLRGERGGMRRTAVNYTLEKKALRQEEWIHCRWSSILRDKIRLFILLANSFQENIWLLRNLFGFPALLSLKNNEGIVKIVHLYWSDIYIFNVAEVHCCQYEHFLKENKLKAEHLKATAAVVQPFRVNSTVNNFHEIFLFQCWCLMIFQ